MPVILRLQAVLHFMARRLSCPAAAWGAASREYEEIFSPRLKAFQHDVCGNLHFHPRDGCGYAPHKFHAQQVWAVEPGESSLSSPHSSAGIS